eukprot:15611035-Heterocapsa_arctica.AAC.1
MSDARKPIVACRCRTLQMPHACSLRAAGRCPSCRGRASAFTWVCVGGTAGRAGTGSMATSRHCCMWSSCCTSL